jgi:hypothetical protein
MYPANKPGSRAQTAEQQQTARKPVPCELGIEGDGLLECWYPLREIVLKALGKCNGLK